MSPTQTRLPPTSAGELSSLEMSGSSGGGLFLMAYAYLGAGPDRYAHRTSMGLWALAPVLTPRNVSASLTAVLTPPVPRSQYRRRPRAPVTPVRSPSTPRARRGQPEHGYADANLSPAWHRVHDRRASGWNPSPQRHQAGASQQPRRLVSHRRGRDSRRRSGSASYPRLGGPAPELRDGRRGMKVRAWCLDGVIASLRWGGRRRSAADADQLGNRVSAFDEASMLLWRDAYRQAPSRRRTAEISRVSTMGGAGLEPVTSCL